MTVVLTEYRTIDTWTIYFVRFSINSNDLSDTLSAKAPVVQKFLLCEKHCVFYHPAKLLNIARVGFVI